MAEMIYSCKSVLQPAGRLLVGRSRQADRFEFHSPWQTVKFGAELRPPFKSDTRGERLNKMRAHRAKSHKRLIDSSCISISIILTKSRP
uniref:Uncharacterized protein n=1 Tax=Globodera rostochiensis TaxID=31243 RepID=A0A914I367_GLORO